LHDRLADTGARLLVETLRLLESGQAPRTPQDHSRATYAPKIRREEGEVDWLLPASEIHNRVRGLNPAPGAYTWLDNSLLKIWLTRLGLEGDMGKPSAAPGEIVTVDEHGPWVKTSAGCLGLERVQPQGGRAMTGLEYARGRHLAPGDRFDRAQGRG
jgi:methionyl-tRNA formyltransferase